jgi:hypothetical protein
MLEEKRINTLAVTKDKVLSDLKYDVASPKDLQIAKQALKKTGALKKVFVNFFDEPVKKAYDAYKSIRDRRNVIVASIEEKETVLKQNIIEYLDKNHIKDGDFVRTEGVDFQINMEDFIEGIKNGNVPENLIAVNEAELKKQIKAMGDLLDIPGITVAKKKFIRLKSEGFKMLS